MNIRFGRKTLMLGMMSTLALLGGAFAILGVAGIVGWEFSNSNQFCSMMCHSVHPEEIAAHKTGIHSRVNCVECHMGRNSTLHLMALKPTHVKELWGMIAGYERPLASSTLRPSREACESCHYPSAQHHDTISIKAHYADDEASSEIRTRLVLRTGVGIIRDTSAKGIHWHILNEVSYVSFDPQRREIPWVQVKKPDGTKVTYFDAASKVTAQQIAAQEPRVMACYDCHNAVGHPFTNPAVQVDEAIATGKIDRSMPNTKARALELIAANEKISGQHDERAKAIDKLLADSAAKANVATGYKDKEKAFNEVMKGILLSASFEEKGLTWKSFVNHTGHSDSAGCFRCHDGKHFNDKGEAIRLQCTLCHALPQVTRENGKGSVPSTITADPPPQSHDAANFMRDHSEQKDETCEKCHGTPLKHGKNGGNFCANPACHGRTWPAMDLSVEPPKKG
jgi:hypothetical protein